MPKRIPIDTADTEPTSEDYERAGTAHRDHVARAEQLPRFHAARSEIAASQAQSQATLRDLRMSLQLTQVTLAEAMGISQSELSRLERRHEIFLSTLDRFVQATGGRLTLTVEYDDRRPVTLSLSALTSERSHEPTNA